MASDSPTSMAPHASSLVLPWAPGFAPGLRCCGSLEGFLVRCKKPWLLQYAAAVLGITGRQLLGALHTLSPSSGT